MSLYERFEKLSESTTPLTTRRRLLGRAAKASLGVALVGHRAGAQWERLSRKVRARLLFPRLPEPVPELHGPWL